MTEFAAESFQRVLLQENVMVFEILKIYRTRLIIEKGVSNRKRHPEKVEENKTIPETKSSLDYQIVQPPFDAKDLEEVIKTLPLEIETIVPDSITHLCINFYFKICLIFRSFLRRHFTFKHYFFSRFYQSIYFIIKIDDIVMCRYKSAEFRFKSQMPLITFLHFNLVSK